MPRALRRCAGSGNAEDQLTLSRLIAIALLLASAPMAAHAYFDPGSGAVLLQLLIAACIGAAYKLRHWLSSVGRAIRNLFRR